MIGNRYEYDAMAKCEQDLWWYRSLHDLTLLKIKENAAGNNLCILDAGCGTGGLLLALKKNGYLNLNGFDLSPDAVSYANRTTGIAVRTLDITQVEKAYKKKYFDIIISHDIVCLLQNGQDKVALSQLLSLLKPGGTLLMNFPALKTFSGTHDLAVGIQKRYSLRAVKKLVANSAAIKELFYWPLFLSPVIFGIRGLQKIKRLFIKKEQVLSDVKMPPAFLNWVLYKIVSFENKKMQFKPWGSSLFLVLQKPVERR